MNYPRAFFELQLRFGEHAARVLRVPLAQALLTHTHLFVRLGCGAKPDVHDPLWDAFVRGLPAACRHPREGGNDDQWQAHALLEWTWRFHLRHRHLYPGPKLERTNGCFGYERLANDRLRLHFLAQAVPPAQALAESQVERRRTELAALFEHAAREPSPAQVIGLSWLYGRAAYRRLFPAAYLAAGHVVDPPPWQRMPLWGQFLGGDGQLREDRARHLLQHAQAAATEADLAAAFPLPVIATQAPASVFA